MLAVLLRQRVGQPMPLWWPHLRLSGLRQRLRHHRRRSFYPPPANFSPPGITVGSRRTTTTSRLRQVPTSLQGEGRRGRRRRVIRRPSRDRGRPLPFVRRGRRLWDGIGGPCRIVDGASEGRGGTDSTVKKDGRGYEGMGSTTITSGGVGEEWDDDQTK
jgi:hypothetical protein